MDTSHNKINGLETIAKGWMMHRRDEAQRKVGQALGDRLHNWGQLDEEVVDIKVVKLVREDQSNLQLR